jgi:F-box/leucine-rich repeat protein 2/20
LSLFHPEYRQVFATSHFIDSFVSMKGLTCLDLKYLNISDELLYSIAREGFPLTRLVLRFCTNFSYNGIFCLLSKCRGIQHLNLQHADFLNDQHLVQLSLFLGDLLSINVGYCHKLTESALFALPRNCPLLSEIKMERIGSRSDIVGNYDSLGKFGVYPQLKGLYLGYNSWLSDEILIVVTSFSPNLQLLDLESCNHISDEGICQVLRKCCKIRHLNLAYCWEVKLHRINFAVPKLEVLNLSCTEVDDETLYLISKNCSRLLQLELDYCSGVTKTGVKCVLENCRQLREHGCITPPSHMLQSELCKFLF